MVTFGSRQRQAVRARRARRRGRQGRPAPAATSPAPSASGPTSASASSTSSAWSSSRRARTRATTVLQVQEPAKPKPAPTVTVTKTPQRHAPRHPGADRVHLNRILLSAVLVVVALDRPGQRARQAPTARRRTRSAAARRARPRAGLRPHRGRSDRLRRRAARRPRPARRPRRGPLRAGALRDRLCRRARPSRRAASTVRPTVPMLVVASAAIGSTLLYAGVGALVGDTAARQVGLLRAAVHGHHLRPAAGALRRPADHVRWPAAARTDPITLDARRRQRGPRDSGAYGWLSSGTGLSASAGSSLFGKGGTAAQWQSRKRTIRRSSRAG